MLKKVPSGPLPAVVIILLFSLFDKKYGCRHGQAARYFPRFFRMNNARKKTGRPQCLYAIGRFLLCSVYA
jgi:hypothetical protein